MTEKQPKPDKAFQIIDMMKPIYIVYHQTEARNIFETFQGPDAEADAKARASQKSVRTKAKVAVFGPQLAVFDPPVIAEAKEVQLDWIGTEADEQ